MVKNREVDHGKKSGCGKIQKDHQIQKAKGLVINGKQPRTFKAEAA